MPKIGSSTIELIGFLFILAILLYTFIGTAYFVWKITLAIMEHKQIDAVKLNREILWFILSVIGITFIAIFVLLVITVVGE
ncbi:MAG: hypothetical protein B6U76_06605 [Desulfurococcales archaeon ex4484_217_2]|nr:MAG: hypothetical protein B6U76_06605 [Desulfurococcales archaeon ex4484_217_2]